LSNRGSRQKSASSRAGKGPISGSDIFGGKMNWTGKTFLAAVCGVALLVEGTGVAAPPASPVAAEEAYEVNATETTTRLHACVEIVRQRPLPDQAKLNEQLRPALKSAEGALKNSRPPVFGGARGPQREACFLDLTAEILHLVADLERIRAVDPIRAGKIGLLMGQESPTLVGTVQNLMTTTLKDDVVEKKNAAISILQTLRSQIELYKLQHRDLPPDLALGWSQLTNRTDDAGKVLEKAPFGPYVRRDPVNPLTGGTKIKLIEQTSQQPLRQDGYTGFDFVFDRAADKLYLVDADGKLFDERY
jgi:hypothetical protein